MTDKTQSKTQNKKQKRSRKVGKPSFTPILTSARTLMFEESAEQWQALLEGVAESIMPVNMVEEIQTERIASGYWRLKRTHEIETVLLSQDCYNPIALTARDEPRMMNFMVRMNFVTGITVPVEYQEPSQYLSQAYTFAGDPDKLIKLTRYEANIEKSIERNFKMLDKRQDRRRSYSAQGASKDKATTDQRSESLH